MKNWSIFLTLTFLLLFNACLGCGDDVDNNSTEATAGALGGACYPNSTCNDGLECRSDLCVWDGTGTDPTLTDTTVTDTPTPDAVLANCVTCGESKCSAETNNCTGTCKTVLDCILKCSSGTDATCIDSCDIATMSADDALAYQALFTCIGLQCVSECSAPAEQPDDTNATKDTDAGQDTTQPDGGSCTVEGESQGSCATNNLQFCTNGNWVTGDCAGCGIVSPSSYCEQIYPLTFYETGSGATYELTSVEPNDLAFTQTSEEVSAEWYIEDSHKGSIQFVFTEPIDPTHIKISVSGDVEAISLETQDGTGGCQYLLNSSSGSLTRDYIERFDEFYEEYVIDWDGCWGTYDDYGLASEPLEFRHMNVRTTTTTTNETINLSISEILW